MWEFLIFLILGAAGTFGLQLAGSYSCNSSSLCIPLSECEVIENMLEDDSLLDYARSSFCGYFHEPYVCCYKNCVTPNGNYGQGVLLEACGHLKANEQSNDQRKRKFLAESYLNKTHVCCNVGEDTYRPVPPAPVDAQNPSTNTPKPLSSSCITPNGELATCKHINDCKAYKEVATETDQNFRFINDSFCGLWKEPMVCCGDVSHYKESYKETSSNVKVCGVWDSTDNPNIPPWLALIKSRKTCVGAVINQEYVLSTVECAGENYEELDIRIGECINDEARIDCRFKVGEFKIFPLYKYLRTEDIGIVLLKLNRAIGTEDFMPACLPINELAIYQAIEIIGLEKTVSNWKGATTSTNTEYNDSCHNAMKMYFERIVCIKEMNLCSHTKRSLLQNLVLYNERDRWSLEGLFNKDSCYGSNNNYFNAIYVYKFLPWIYSNLN